MNASRFLPGVPGRVLSALVVGSLCLWMAGSRGAAEAPARGKRVASVAAIDGALSVQRAGEDRWYGGYVRMPDYLDDRLKTDASSMAALDFVSGGRVGLGRGSELEIREHGVVQGGLSDGAHGVVLASGTVWARFSPQERPFLIRTKSALLSVKGTEFTVECASDQTTTLSVLEGRVAYAPVGDGACATAVATEGMQITLAWKKVPVVRTYPVGTLREQLDKRFPGLDHWLVRQYVGNVWQGIENNPQAVAVITDPNRVVADIRRRVSGNLEPLRRMGIQVPGLDPAGPKADFPSGLAPDQAEVEAAGLTFRWEPLDGCQQYVLLLSRDEAMETLDWSARTRGTSLSYPGNGFPLLPGVRHFWRVIGLDGNGTPVGRAGQTWFTPAPARR